MTAELPASRSVKYARLVGTADNEFTAYVNGARVLAGTVWENAVFADVTKPVRTQPEVTIAVTARNTEPGAAGMRCALAIWFEGEKVPMLIHSGPSWRSSDEAVEGWEKPGFDDRAWPEAIAVEPDKVWARLKNFELTIEPPFIRAALVKIDAFQNILGRPVRDQVIMSRPTPVTLLQAMTFANGRPFTTALDRAAATWTAKLRDPQQRLAAIYHAALLRDPRPDELAFAQADTRDLLWSVLLQPEFQLIH